MQDVVQIVPFQKQWCGSVSRQASEILDGDKDWFLSREGEGNFMTLLMYPDRW